MEKHESKIPFLDVLVYMEGRKLHTVIFYKKTDTHQYLNFNSCHPKHTKQNIYFYYSQCEKNLTYSQCEKNLINFKEIQYFTGQDIIVMPVYPSIYKYVTNRVCCTLGHTLGCVTH